MTIVYCDWATGDDTNGTGSWDHPYKTITKASTGLTGGDEVRVAKSPEPTALTGTLGFTNNSTAVTGNGTAFTTELAIGDFIKGGDGYWWEVITISSDTSATLYRPYSGTTQSGVSSQRLGVTDTGAAGGSTTQVQVVSSSGTSSANLKISGGWDLSTETQTGQTFFRQLNTTTFANRYGYGLYISGKTYTELSNLNFLRYRYGISYYSSSSNNTIIGSPICNSNGFIGIYYNGSNNNTITGSPVCNSNGQYGIYYYNGSNNTITGSPVCNSNGQYGIYYYNGSNNTITGSPVCNSNGQYGIYYSSSNNNYIYGTLTTSGNTSGAIYNDFGINYILKASIAESTKVTGFTNYVNARICIGNMGGQSYIYTDGGNIVSQNATAGGTGKEWVLSPTSDKRGAKYPLDLSVAKVAVAGSGQVTVKLYFKKTGTGVAGALRVRYGQINWSDDAEDKIVNCPDNTSRNQVTLQFTPTEAGVVEIEALAWYVSSTTQSVIVDDIDISQGKQPALP